MPASEFPTTAFIRSWLATHPLPDGRIVPLLIGGRLINVTADDIITQ